MKHPSWFRLEHSLFDNPDFYDFTHVEKLAWIYLLCVASKKNSGAFTLSWPHVEKIGGFKKKDFENALQKLQAIQIVHVDVTDALRARDVDVTHTLRGRNATDRQDRHNKTDITEQDLGATAPAFEVSDLIQIWNEKAKTLPKVEKTTKSRSTAARARISEQSDPGYWIRVVERIEASDFCKNLAPNSKGWIATFDWLVTPDAHVKVMEGKYDNRGHSPAGKPQGILDILAEKGRTA